MIGAFGMALLGICACGWGSLLLRRWIAELDPALRLAATGLVGFGSMGLISFFLGMVSLPVGLFVGIGVPGLAGVYGLSRGLVRDFKFTLPKGVELVAPSAIGLALVFALVGVLAPSTTVDWDSLAYHLAVPKIWLAYGRVDFISFIHHSNFPQTVDAMFLWGLQFGGESGAKMVSWIYFALALLGVFGLTRSRYNATAAWWATVSFATIPAAMWLSGTAYIDVANGAFAGLGLALAVVAVVEKDSKFAVLAGVLLGFAAGSKYTGLQTIAVAGIVMLALSRGKELRSAALVVGLAVAVAAPWYVRNVVNTGNPVYPFFYSVFGGKNWSPYNATIYSHEQQTFGAGRAMAEPGQDYVSNPLEPLRLGHAVLGLAYQPGRYINPGQTQGQGLPLGALGATALLAGLLWLASGLSRKFENGILAGVGLSFALWFFLSEQSRYIIALILPLTVLLGGAVVRLALGRVLAAAQVAQSLLGLYVLNSLLVSDQLQVVSGKVSPEDYQSQRIGFYRTAQRLNQLVPATGKVALYDEVFGFLLDVPYFWANPGHTTELGYDAMTTGDELIASFGRLGITHVCLSLASTAKEDRPSLEAGLGLNGPASAFTDEIRTKLMADPGSKWRALLVDAAQKGHLRFVEGAGAHVIFEVVP
jgi:4-amino-4-deoxy-L-arabinose transferase-like glycosyltransferase